MEYILIPLERDRPTIDKFVDEFTGKSKIELVSIYNSSNDVGIVGSRGQALRLLALAMVFKRVFGDVPIKYTNDWVMSLPGRIRLENEMFVRE